MTLSRRSFLGGVGTAAAAATVLPFPLGERLAFAGEPPRARTAGGPILLNSNENAYGPSAKVMAEAQRALGLAMRYPDRQYEGLRERIAKLHQVKVEQVFLGNGSTEILKMAANAFVDKNHKLVMPMLTFEAISYYANHQPGVQVAYVGPAGDYSLGLNAFLGPARQGAGLVYICNPNNPTGTLTPRQEIEDFIRALPASTYVLIDEAYHHFAVGAPGYESFLDKPVDDPRILVARTFSKVYGMAGLRLGYGIVPAGAVRAFEYQRTQDNVNIVSALCGQVALDDQAAVAVAVKRTAGERAEFQRQAARRKLTVMPSFANFFMYDAGRPVPQLIADFKKNNILVGRDFHYGNWLRVSLGLPNEMTAFWNTWDKISA
ncbi:MAG TPA: histidinol-phosphate transaminase [Terriglobales bacterium]|jgi:histidinol-phosphate aminotransferase|nr:histidinol-phosphate transaminase [Terriglobales bacterium]